MKSLNKFRFPILSPQVPIKSYLCRKKEIIHKKKVYGTVIIAVIFGKYPDVDTGIGSSGTGRFFILCTERFTRVQSRERRLVAFSLYHLPFNIAGLVSEL
jgi:hypothetical protein